MIKTIRYNGGCFNVSAAAASLIIYKEQFGCEYLEDYIKSVGNALDGGVTGYRLVWSMAKCADRSIPDPNEFGRMLGKDFDLMGAVEACAEIMIKSMGEFLTGEDDESGSDDGEESGIDTLSERLVAAAVRVGLSVEDLYSVSVGFLLRALNAYYKTSGKNDENKVKRADENDINAFLAFMKG